MKKKKKKKKTLSATMIGYAVNIADVLVSILTTGSIT